MYLLRWVDDAPEFLPKLVLLREGLLVSRAAFLPLASVFMAARRFSWPARMLGAHARSRLKLRARYVAYGTAAAASLSG